VCAARDVPPALRDLPDSIAPATSRRTRVDEIPVAARRRTKNRLTPRNLTPRATMTKPHETQPQLCADCLEVLHARVAADPEAGTQLFPCRHGTGVTVAVAFIERGRITSWQTSGPVDEQQATALAAAWLRANLNNGGHLRTLVTQ
jgi:hypothetical protein